MNKLFAATLTLLGGIFGAGFLGIPYVLKDAGFFIGLIEMFVLSLILVSLALLLNNFLFTMKEVHQFTGYAEKYFGKTGKLIMFIAFAVGLYTSIIAYLIGEGQSFSYLFLGTTNYEFYFGLLFWLILAALVYFGIKALEKGEVIGVLLVFVTVILIASLYGPNVNVENLITLNSKYFLVSVGVIFFALINFSGIPTVKQIVGNDKKTLHLATILAYTISFVVYAGFTAVVIGFKGINVPEIATLGLGKIFVVLGILTIFTSAFSVCLAIRNTWLYDWKTSKNISWVLTMFPPLVVFGILTLIGYTKFTGVINIGVTISGVLTALFLVALLAASKIKSFRK